MYVCMCMLDVYQPGAVHGQFQWRPRPCVWTAPRSAWTSVPCAEPRTTSCGAKWSSRASGGELQQSFGIYSDL